MMGSNARLAQRRARVAGLPVLTTTGRASDLTTAALATATRTPTARPTATRTATSRPTPTRTATSKPTPTRTATSRPTPTRTATAATTATATRVPLPTPTRTATGTTAPTTTATTAATGTPTATTTATTTGTPTATATSTATPTATSTPTSTSTATPTGTPTSTPSPTPTVATATSSASDLFGYTLDDLPYTATLNASALPGTPISEVRSYDGDNRLTSVQYSGPYYTGQAMDASFTYAYSPLGVTTGFTAAGGGTATQSYLLGYDALGRLTSSSGSPTEQWSYDGNGNLRALRPSPGITTTYAYAHADGSEPAGWLPNELVSTDDAAAGAQLSAYAYDGSGNTVAITTSARGSTPQVAQALTYDAEGRLSSVASTAGVTMTMGYNAQGLRSSIVVTDSQPEHGTATNLSEALQYRGDRVGQVTVAEPGQATFTETFLYRQDGEPLEVLYHQAGKATVRYWYELDGRGDVIALTDATGAVVQQYSYDAWGKLLPQLQSTGGGALGLTTEAVPQPLRYRGYWYDGWYDGAALYNSGTYASTETRPVAWYWLRTRSYDPALERFLQPDPSALDGVRSYAYCHDDPIDCADPSGLVSESTEPPVVPEPPGGRPIVPPGGVEGSGLPAGNAGIDAAASLYDQLAYDPARSLPGSTNKDYLTFDQYEERYGTALDSRTTFGSKFGSATSSFGRVLAARGKYFLRYLPKGIQSRVSIGVARLDISGVTREVAILYNKPTVLTDDIIAQFQAKVETVGAKFVLTEPGEHVEPAAYRIATTDYAAGNEDFSAIGTSNYPCYSCQRTFTTINAERGATGQEPVGLYYFNEFADPNYVP